MKIATWNIERLKHKRQLEKILNACEQLNSDIMTLTETDEQVQLKYNYSFKTPPLHEIQPKYYKMTENRISIFTNYKCIRQYETYDKYTALCIELETELGNLIVYGTIIGIHGNRRPSFNQDLLQQVKDFNRLSAINNFCVCGDFNCSFADNYYFTKLGRDTLLQAFSDSHIKLLTGKQVECIDHIAITDKFMSDNKVDVEEWNIDKKLSDHKGIAVRFNL